jgi:hypothetical protein
MLEGMNWMNVPENRDSQRAVVNTIINFRLP